MRQKIYWLIPISVISLAISLAACGPTRPPNTGLEDATSGLDAARAAGASTYAPLEIRNAEERLSLARAAVDKRDYDTALQLSQESRVNSDLAVAKSHLGKVREKVEARTRENAQLQQDLSANGGDGNTGGGQR
jgi:hypothetical protein